MEEKDFFYSSCKKNIFEISPETHLFFKFVKPCPMDRILSIGCCSHDLYRVFLGMNFDITAVDEDKGRLSLLKQGFHDRIPYEMSPVTELPFTDNEFEYSFFFNTLRFSDDPEKTLAEAFRVTRHGVFIGVENRYAIKGVQKAIHGFFSPGEKERLFGIWELKQMIKNLAGDVPVKWRTVTMENIYNNYILEKIGYNDLIEKTPFGNFVGIFVILQPKYELKPLTLSVKGGNKLKIAGSMAPRSVTRSR